MWIRAGRMLIKRKIRKDIIANYMNDTFNNFKVTDRQSFIKFLDLLRKDLLDDP